ncbi:MAG: hypothetical protein LUH03_05030 [Oscillospiraceae bacterium]|nr:hypothetical protein [Oscillospiraceae bacterium]
MLDALYVLVSNENDTYLEQVILSIESKKALPDVKAYALIDKSTVDTLSRWGVAA